MPNTIGKSCRFEPANSVISWHLAAAVWVVGLITTMPRALAQHASGQAECQAQARQLKVTLDLGHKQRTLQIATERNNAVQRCGLDTNCRNAASERAVQLTLDNNEQHNTSMSQAQTQLMQCNLIVQKPLPEDTFSSNDRPGPTLLDKGTLKGGVADENRTPPPPSKPVTGGTAYPSDYNRPPLRSGTTTGAVPGMGATQSTGLPYMTGKGKHQGFDIDVAAGGPQAAVGKPHNGDPRHAFPGSPFSLVEGRITGPRTVNITAVTWANSGKRDQVDYVVQMKCLNPGCQ
jgi:hypothetical protein